MLDGCEYWCTVIRKSWCFWGAPGQYLVLKIMTKLDNYVSSDRGYGSGSGFGFGDGTDRGDGYGFI